MGGLMIIPVGPDGGNQVSQFGPSASLRSRIGWVDWHARPGGSLVPSGGLSFLLITSTNAAPLLPPSQALYRIEKVKEGGPVEESFVAQELMGVRCVLVFWLLGHSAWDWGGGGARVVDVMLAGDWDGRLYLAREGACVLIYVQDDCALTLLTCTRK